MLMPYLTVHRHAEGEVPMAVVQSKVTSPGEMSISELLQSQPVTVEPASFVEEQRKDPCVLEIAFNFLRLVSFLLISSMLES